VKFLSLSSPPATDNDSLHAWSDNSSFAWVRWFTNGEGRKRH